MAIIKQAAPGKVRKKSIGSTIFLPFLTSLPQFSYFYIKFKQNGKKIIKPHEKAFFDK